MATARPFAFNTGSTVSGTTQIGDLGVGVDAIRYDLHPGDITWYMGADEELGYIIARPNPSFYRPKFLRSAFTEQGFLDSCNYVSRKESGPVFTNTLDAKNWLAAQGYWTTYTGGTGPTPTPSATPSPTPTPSAAVINSLTGWTNSPTLPFSTFVTDGAEITTAVDSGTYARCYCNEIEIEGYGFSPPLWGGSNLAFDITWNSGTGPIQLHAMKNGVSQGWSTYNYEAGTVHKTKGELVPETANWSWQFIAPNTAISFTITNAVWTYYDGTPPVTPTPTPTISITPTPSTSPPPASPTPTPTPSTSEAAVLPTALELAWDNIVNVPGAITDPADETQWNTFFDLPTNGTAFNSATVDGNNVTLHGGGNMTIKSVLFQNNTNILGISETGTGTTVTTVGTEAFSSATNLTTARLSGCTSVQGTAGSQWYGGFYNCTSLSTVDFTSLQTIQEGGFASCTSLITPSFPALTSIGEQAFAFCSNLTTPSMPVLANIGYQGFLNCTSMTVAPGSNNVTNTTNLSYGAYQGCSSLTNPSFPSLTAIQTSVFQGCTALTTPSFPSLLTINSNAFRSCTNLSTTAWSGVTFVGATAFQDCTSLTSSIDFSSLDSTSSNSFLNCTGLISLEFPSLTTLESGTFVGCTNLSSFVASGCTLIDIGAFNGCSGLTSVDLPILITVGSAAFIDCVSITSLSFPAATTIGNGAFRYCTSLASVYLPSCTALGSSVLDNFVFEDNNDPTVTVPTALATVNAGNPDGDLQYVTDTLSGTVNYI